MAGGKARQGSDDPICKFQVVGEGSQVNKNEPGAFPDASGSLSSSKLHIQKVYEENNGLFTEENMKTIGEALNNLQQNGGSIKTLKADLEEKIPEWNQNPSWLSDNKKPVLQRNENSGLFRNGKAAEN